MRCSGTPTSLFLQSPPKDPDARLLHAPLEALLPFLACQEPLATPAHLLPYPSPAAHHSYNDGSVSVTSELQRHQTPTHATIIHARMLMILTALKHVYGDGDEIMEAHVFTNVLIVPHSFSLASPLSNAQLQSSITPDTPRTAVLACGNSEAHFKQKCEENLFHYALHCRCLQLSLVKLIRLWTLKTCIIAATPAATLLMLSAKRPVDTQANRMMN
ncbi:hypothetical protein E2C01_060817 [Portunus trituberculatus]|uniref:Uncharacterized protein n=1 Tax=Portunus trituberculatus TaxID=210409 RepID=A0A5B7H9R0_PORTR|nr:hypothetical protein [Portunus trituberculatus]